MVFFFAGIKFFSFWPKTMDLYIVHGLIFGSPKKVLRNVCHPKGEKKNLMALVSVA